MTAFFRRAATEKQFGLKLVLIGVVVSTSDDPQALDNLLAVHHSSFPRAEDAAVCEVPVFRLAHAKQRQLITKFS
ncbi:hypothetical protein D3C85_1641030 [compost metagenome]